MKSVHKRISDLFKISQYAPKPIKTENQGSVLTSRETKPSRPSSKRVIISDNRANQSTMFLTASNADHHAANIRKKEMESQIESMMNDL